MKIVAIVQARAASTRLPAKILLDLGGKTALERCLWRVTRFRHIGEVIVATGDAPANDVVQLACARLGYTCMAGSEEDVLGRYLDIARQLDADVVVRCTSDCPLLDPERSSRVIEAFIERARRADPADFVDYAANNLVRRLPRGLDTEIVTRAALEAVARSPAEFDLASSGAGAREHVTFGVWQNPERFRLLAVDAEGPDHSGQRWTLDTLDDYRFLAHVFAELGPRADSARMQDVLDLLAARPELTQLNAHVEQKTV